MIIKELILVSFGKFKNMPITFEKGLNIIYGKNEAGKTTIHKFIEAMFFGFFKLYSKRKLYTEEYDKYYPWNQNSYKGILKYIYEDNLYRIERNFEKGSEEVKIFDDKTGEDVTYLFPYDKVTRLHNPASTHLELNSTIYNNTINIRQLGNKTETELAREVKDNLINLRGSLDEDISIKNVIKDLNSQIDEIGTITRVKTSPYGKVADEINQLESEKEKTLQIMNEIKEYQQKLNNLSIEIQKLEKQKSEMENKIKNLDVYRAKIKYEKAIRLMKEIESLQKEIEDLKKYSFIKSEDYTEAIKLDNSTKTLEETLKKYIEKKNNLDTKINSILEKINEFQFINSINETKEIGDIFSTYKILESKREELNNINIKIETLNKKLNEANQIDISNINEDFSKYEELEGQRDRLQYANESNNLIFLNSKFEEKQKELKRLNTLKIVSFISGLILLPLGYFANPLLYLLFIIPLSVSIYYIVTSKDLKKDIKKIQKQLSDAQTVEKEKKEKIQQLENTMTQILKKYNCSNKSDFRTFFSTYSSQALYMKNNENILKDLMDSKNRIEKEISIYESSIKKIMDFCWLKGEVDFENVNKIKNLYDNYLELIKSKESLERELFYIKGELEDLQLKREGYIKALQHLFESNNVKSIEELKLAVEKRNRLEELKKEIDNKNNLIKSILGNESLENLKIMTENYTCNIDKDIKELNREEIENRISNILENIRLMKEETARLEEKIRALSSNNRPLVDVEEDILRKSKIKQGYEQRLKALELAKNTINEISKKIQRDFSPKLNNGVGNVISHITGGKYREVKISEALEMKVVEPNTNELIDIEKLSYGTIDQIYFALRFGIINIIKENTSYPLILDDCFIQYDENRLKNILDFLIKESNNRQIILFTCHNREKQLLDKMGVKYNYFEL